VEREGVKVGERARAVTHIHREYGETVKELNSHIDMGDGVTSGCRMRRKNGRERIK